ncbi:hypothetical protein PE066_09605 [Ramlibacter tataouinensis]|uniref:hypothetical protein n=1 Tax=Ramlibacter tataouinensis TaxID=94132 RepID=UPI0022F3B8F9|nr:hypothetical protein [Ramlibacter tataouinensis]WBY03765.1 hypothetical protein PE066_09605 [Ramlibacter tataouinensis]
MALAAAMGFGAPGWAATLGVSAVLLPSASIELRSQPTALEISTGDVSRGYVDVPAPLSLTVRSNSLRALMLRFTLEGEWVSGMDVQGLPAALHLGPEGGQVLLTPSPGQLQVELRFRVWLAGSVAPGRYRWPAQVAVAN